MKKLWFVLILVLTAGMLFGCGDTTTSTSTAPTNVNQNFDERGTLQGKIMDALTGAALGGSDLQVFLIQGTSNRTPDKLITDTNNALVGEYAFSNIPVTLTANTTFKVVAIKNGYQRFEGNLVITAIPFGGGPTTGLTLDENYNMIGNIYLFPMGAASGDVSVFVFDPVNVPIPGARVHLTQNINSNEVLVQAGNRLGASGGLISSLTATTDANGLATFAGSSLTLGGNYSVQVEPLTFQGVRLAFNNIDPSSLTGFFVGIDSSVQTVNMTTADDVLFATSASNQVPGTITANGVLSVTFNQPITLSTTFFTATMTAPGTPSPQTVTGILSNNNTTLTLTPTIATAPTAAGSTIIYTFGGTITLQNSQTPTPFTLFGGINPIQNITTGNPVSGTVHMTAD